MLVLSRQRDETIMIGDEIEITVVDIRGDKVRLGINAPTRIAVHRKEVYEAIRRENEQAARIDRADLASLTPVAEASHSPAGILPGPAKTATRAIAARVPGTDAATPRELKLAQSVHVTRDATRSPASPGSTTSTSPAITRGRKAGS
jgi:carbon storage regulator